MDETRPPLDYLISCSNASLESLELSRLNRAANLRKQLRQMLEDWIESEVDARLSRWVLECRRAQTAAGADARAENRIFAATSKSGETRNRLGAGLPQTSLFDAFDTPPRPTLPPPQKPDSNQEEKPAPQMLAKLDHAHGSKPEKALAPPTRKKLPAGKPPSGAEQPSVCTLGLERGLTVPPPAGVLDPLSADDISSAGSTKSALRRLEKVALHHAHELQYSLYSAQEAEAEQNPSFVALENIEARVSRYGVEYHARISDRDCSAPHPCKDSVAPRSRVAFRHPYLSKRAAEGAA